MIQLDFKPPFFNSMEPMLPEPTLEIVRIQAIKLHRRKHIIIAMGCMLLICIIGGMWWYYIQGSSLENKILEQAGTHVEDGLEEIEPLSTPPKEEFPMFKVQVIDDGLLYSQAEDAFLQKKWDVAIQKYKILAVLYPKNIALWFNLALSYHHNQDVKNARYWYEKILLHKPQHAEAKHNLQILTLENVTKAPKDTENTSKRDQF